MQQTVRNPFARPPALIKNQSRYLQNRFQKHRRRLQCQVRLHLRHYSTPHNSRLSSSLKKNRPLSKQSRKYYNITPLSSNSTHTASTLELHNSSRQSQHRAIAIRPQTCYPNMKLYPSNLAKSLTLHNLNSGRDS